MYTRRQEESKGD